MGEMTDDEDWAVVLHALATETRLTDKEEAALAAMMARVASLVAENERLTAECAVLKRALQREAH